MNTVKHSVTSFVRWLGIGHVNEKTLRDKYFNEHSLTVSVEGYSVHYRREGVGEPLVLLHGILSSLHTWDDWTAQLKKDFEVIRIDLPGFGFSSLPVDGDLYGDQEIVLLMQALFKKLGLVDVHLAGNSLGGYIAWNYALLNPEQVKSLTVIDPLSYRIKPPLLLRLSALPVIGKVSGFMIPKVIFNIGVKQVYAKPNRVKASTRRRYFELLMRRGNKRNFIQVVRSLGKLARQQSLGDAIKCIRVPTLVMWGDKDRWIPVRHASTWQQDLPDAEVKIYKGIGHVPMEENPVSTASDVKKFIQNIKS